MFRSFSILLQSVTKIGVICIMPTQFPTLLIAFESPLLSTSMIALITLDQSKDFFELA